MPKFKVTLEVSTYVSAEVEADSCLRSARKIVSVGRCCQRQF